MKDLFITNGIVKRPVDLDYMMFISSSAISRRLSTTHILDKVALDKMPDGKAKNYLFSGNANGHFTDISLKCGITVPSYSNGAAYADLDNDGRLDLIVNNINEEATILHNINPNKNHYLTLSLKSNTANSFGIGCKAYLFDNGKLQYQELMLTRGFQSSSEPRLHFGVDTSSVVDSLLIVWPDQSYKVLHNIATDQKLVIKQGLEENSFNYASFFKQSNPFFKDVTASENFLWKHQENNFSDFSRQYLIPHELSTAGPKLAVGDATNDGLDDFYACGAKGQPGALFIQTKEGHFIQSMNVCFDADRNNEDADALFFDADNDGDLDLYVCSGGNEVAGNNTLLQDRLYINDGKGNFSKSVNQIPSIDQNKSVVCTADIDHDGDMDLFVGVRADAFAYGLPQTSFILVNDGKGYFSLMNNALNPFKNIGMVTSAVFADINKDGWPDLIVAGEWMPVSIFINDHVKFIQQKNNELTGLWQSLAISDVNGDGNVDILAGNYGWNSKLHADKNANLKLYLKDFDNNGMYDQILTYTVQGKEYSFLGKEQLEKQLPSIRKRFLKYSDFAGKTVQEVFGNQLDNALSLNAQTLASGIFVNDGKGNFSFNPFPWEVQESPLFSFLTEDVDQDGLTDIITGGNLYGVLPYEGKYDANWGDILLNKNTKYQWISPVNSGWLVRGETRDIKKIKTAKDTLYIVARNNNSLLFFRHFN
jgi:hypothetical protein